MSVDQEVARLKTELFMISAWSDTEWSKWTSKGVVGTYQYLSLSQSNYLAAAARVGALLDRLAMYSQEEESSPNHVGRQLVDFAATRFTVAMQKLDDQIAIFRSKRNSATGAEGNLTRQPVDESTVLNVPTGILAPQKKDPSDPESPFAQYIQMSEIPSSVATYVGLGMGGSSSGANQMDGAVRRRALKLRAALPVPGDSKTSSGPQHPWKTKLQQISIAFGLSNRGPSTQASSSQDIELGSLSNTDSAGSSREVQAQSHLIAPQQQSFSDGWTGDQYKQQWGQENRCLRCCNKYCGRLSGTRCRTGSGCDDEQCAQSAEDCNEECVGDCVSPILHCVSKAVGFCMGALASVC